MSKYLDYEGLTNVVKHIKSIASGKSDVGHDHEITDVTGLSDALTNAGKIKTVNSISPDESGNIDLGLSKVATSGSYNDLSNKPTIPTTLKNPNALTLKGAGTSVTSYDGSAAKALDIVAGSNVTVTADTTNGKITIASTDTNTDTKVTSVDNHYTPAENTSSALNASGGTITDIANGSGTQVVTGLKRDAKGHVVGVTSVALKATNNTYTIPTTLKNPNAVSLKGAGTEVVSYDGSSAKAFDIVAGSNVTITPDATNGKITISSTDTNTVYTHPTSGVTAGTYKSVTVNANGHVTAGTNPTTISGYGITDAYTKTETDSAINNKIAAADAMIYKGTIGTSGIVTALPNTTAKTGWTYKVITAGTYDSNVCEIGDMLVCLTDGSSSTNATWTVIQTNIDGAVTGPASSTDAHIAVFNGTTGKVVKDSGYTIAKSVPSNAVFTDTDTKVTAVDNHYAPAEDTSSALSASGGTLTDIANSSAGTQVVTGLKRDAKGHVVGVTSVALKATNNTYTIPTTLKNPNAISMKGAGTEVVSYDGSAAKTLDIVAGSNVTVTADATNSKITIAATDTNTHYASKNVVGITTATSNTTSALTNGNVYLNSVENGAVTSSHKISGTGATTVTTDASGNIVITSTDNNTVYTHPTATAYNSGLYKVTVNGTGHITAATAVTKADITGLGIPASDTDTHYTTGLKVGASASATANAAATNGNVYINALDNTTVRDSHKIVGSGATTVTSDADGVITISSTDTNTNTTYSAGTGLSLSGTTFNHSNSVTAGTAGTSSATSGSTLAVPYVTYDAQGHVTGSGTHTHTITGFNNYSLPTASADTLGGIKVGSNLTISNGVLSGTANTTYSAGSNITLSGTTFSLTKANVTGALGYTPAIITSGTTDLTAGTSALATGNIYLVYE